MEKEVYFMKEHSGVHLAMPSISLWDIKTWVCRKNFGNEHSALQWQIFRFPNGWWNSQTYVRHFAFRKPCMAFRLKSSSEQLQSRCAKLVLDTVESDKSHKVIGLTAWSVLSVLAQTVRYWLTTDRPMWGHLFLKNIKGPWQSFTKHFSGQHSHLE